jgi:nitrile hydratase
MDGIHDMGGMHGFGEVAATDRDPVFATEWQGRVFANTLAMLIFSGGNLDRFRFLIEAMPPAEYVSSSYYERWLAAMLSTAVEQGLLDRDQVEAIQAGRVPDVQPENVEPLLPEIAGAMVDHPTGTTLDRSGVAAFEVGDRVLAKTMHREGHTRLPRYVRGRSGTVVSDNGNHHLPDARAEDGSLVMQRMYTVAFTARELWGASANPRDSVRLELWESYLEPV